MLRKSLQTIGVLAIGNYIYNSGYQAGKNNSSFFRNVANKIEEQLPSEHKADFRNDINHCEHEIRKATNSIREKFGLRPK